MRCSNVIGIAGVLIGSAMAGMGSEGGFDADMFIRFPGFFVAPRAAAVDLQAFTGALGGVAAEAVTASGDATRPFTVNGNTFTDFLDAATRSCDDQQNACSDIANSPSKNTDGITVAECQAQLTSCLALASTPATSTTTTAATSTTAAVVQETTSTTPVVVAATTTTPAAVAGAPVVASSNAGAAAASVIAASPTLHSSDENFFYFCDP